MEFAKNMDGTKKKEKKKKQISERIMSLAACCQT
jgi:hypothetical protein